MEKSQEITEAAQSGDAATVRQLVDLYPELVRCFSADGWTPLHLAAYFGHASIAEYLVEHGADVLARSQNAMANQPIHAAVAGKQSAMARWLIERGAEPDSKQHGGWTPLHAAAQNGDAELVAFLLAHGADKTFISDAGQTAASLAAEKNHAAVMKLLGSGPSAAC